MSLSISGKSVQPSFKALLESAHQQIQSVEIAKGQRFKPLQTTEAEETVLVMKGFGTFKIGDEKRAIVPNTLVRLTADKVVKIYNEQEEPLQLFWIKATVQVSGEQTASNPLYVRKKEECFEIKATEQERIYEMFGKDNGDARQHSVALVDIHEGGSSARHYHPVVDETYLITEGEGKLVIDSMESHVKAGDIVVIPVGKNHQIFNVAKETLKLTVVVTPPWTIDCGVYN